MGIHQCQWICNGYHCLENHRNNNVTIQQFLGNTNNVPLKFRQNNTKAGRIDNNRDVILGLR
ncbi:MAG: hypothetical protein IPL50_17930 [Chitinophagaceae bacterium]|nr:hypothetical protein [Chitinophagaceae bacterium]